MVPAAYSFRTSIFNWRSGIIIGLASVLFFTLMQMKSHANLYIGAGLAALTLACFLGRFTLLLDLQSHRVFESRGIWPFVRKRWIRIEDFSNLEIKWVSGNAGGSYVLWLIENTGRRISLAQVSSWLKLNNQAQELSAATGWPVVDHTNGRNSISALLG